MDRVINYPGQIAVETDLLKTNRNTMIAIGKLAGALFGTGGVVNGLAVGPSAPAALSVSVAPGEIYQLENVDSTAYSSLPADTTDSVVKQGIALAAQTLACAAPSTAGYSINYLIQATYQDSDTGAVALPYYNASNPTQAYSGPNNSGTPQATQRSGIVVVNAKAGTAATTGSQVTPTVDSGYIALAVVTVANGQTTITGANITQLAASYPKTLGMLDLASVASGKGAALVGYKNPASGTVARTLQAVAAEKLSINDFGTTNAGFQAAATQGGEVRIPSGTYAPGTVTAGANASFWDAGVALDGGGLPLNLPGTQQLWYGTSRMFYQPNGGITDSGVLRVQRTTNYSGAGANAYENYTVKVLLTANAAAGSYETGVLTVLDNYATSTSAENVAHHVQANKRSTSPTWCLANEASDLTATADPATGLVGIEQVVAANGTDASKNRVGLDIIASRPNSGGVYSGVAAEVGYGIRLINQTADTGTANKFVIGAGFLGNYRIAVIDTSGATLDTGCVALRMGSGQLFSLTTNSDRTLDYSSGYLNYRVAGTPKYQVDDSGNTNQMGVLKISGVQILSSQSTGWGAPTGTLSRAAFDPSTVTLQTLAQVVAALITDLRNHHGIIGA